MELLIQYLIENKEWIFSGIGVFIISVFAGVFFRKYHKKQSQKVSKNSIGIQADGDITINNKHGK